MYFLIRIFQILVVEYETSYAYVVIQLIKMITLDSELYLCNVKIETRYNICYVCRVDRHQEVNGS